MEESEEPGHHDGDRDSSTRRVQAGDEATQASTADTAAATTRSRTAFISGPLDVGNDDAYFHTYYAAAIDEAMARGDRFVVGPIPTGVDAVALRYLLHLPGSTPHQHGSEIANPAVAPERVTVFVTVDENRVWGDQFRALGINVQLAGTGPRERDAAMTAASDYDILRWRTEAEAKEFYGPAFRKGHITNTERNWRRRQGLDENPPPGEGGAKVAELVERSSYRSEPRRAEESNTQKPRDSHRGIIGRIKGAFKSK